jgi:hypothetical protein
LKGQIAVTAYRNFRSFQVIVTTHLFMANSYSCFSEASEQTTSTSGVSLPTFFPILESYLSDRQSRTRVKDEVSALFPIKSGVPQGSVLGPLLYILFTSDLTQAPNVTVGTFADDTAILTSHTNVKRVSSTLQEYLHILSRWLQKWKIKVNETKSSYLTFTLRHDPSPPIYLNEVDIPPQKQ